LSADVVARIRAAIDAGRFGELIGLEEGVTFEAKGSQPYDLDEANGRYELAKDVSALANSAGGFLIIGLKTKASAVGQTDVVSDLDLLPVAEFPTLTILGVIREYVAPSISGLHVEWFPSLPADGTGIGVIEVPLQSDDAKPFIICKVIDGESRLKQIVFGYCRRVGPDSLPHDATAIRSAMRQGMNSVSQRLTGIEQKLGLVLDEIAESQEPTAVPPAPAEASQLLAERINKITKA
jgi:hypothetical protein